MRPTEKEEKKKDETLSSEGKKCVSDFGTSHRTRNVFGPLKR